jgi:aspartate kinase
VGFLLLNELQIRSFRNGAFMVIMKFGGTSVEDASAIRRVAEIVRSRRKRNPVVVVSAMAKITDQLVAMGHQAASGDCDSSLAVLQSIRERHLSAARDLLGKKSVSVATKIQSLATELENFIRGIAAVKELSARSNDYLLSFGELLSSQIVAAAFPALGLDAQWVDSRQCLVTDGNHTRARPLMAETSERSQGKIARIVADERIPVMGGFIASTLEGITTTLGRGGSDYSAAILGAALDAESIEIWTDVEGMMTTDPRVCPDARTIPRISFNEAAELAYFGAKVLHPATLLPAIHKNIPVYVLNSRNLKSKGTRITAHAPSSGDTFRAITAKTGVSIVNVVASRGVMVHGFLRSVFEALDLHGSSVDIVAISEVSMSFTMESKRLPKALIADLEKIAEVNCDDQQAIICLVGEDIHGVLGIAASVFSTIAKAGVNIRMISQGASELNISFVIRESDVPQAVRHLHARFFGNQSGVKSAARAKVTMAKAPREANGASNREASETLPSRNGRPTRAQKQEGRRPGSVRQNSSVKAAAYSKGL